MDGNSFHVNSKLPPTNFFIYKEEKYPFNLNLFNLYSNYFISNPVQPNSNIKLIEDEEHFINLTDSSIQDFINHCQCKDINLTNQNVLSIHKLAKKFKVNTLIEETEKYISNHKNDFIIHFLSINHDKLDIDTEQYEEILSQNLNDYIKDDQLLSLPLPILYRILTRHQLKNKENKSHQSPEVTEFLFKCLDHFGREASVLFEFVEFGKIKNEVLHRLLTDYSDIFDFHFINSNLFKTLYEIQNEILSKEENIKIEQEQMREEIRKLKKQQEINNKKKDEQIKQQQNDMKEEIQRIKIQQEETNKNKDEQIQQKQNEMKEEIQKMKIQQEEINKNKDEQIQQYQTEMREERERIKQQSEIFQNLTKTISQQQNIISELIKQINDLKRKPITIHYSGGKDHNGIVSFLGESVILSAGGYLDPQYPVTNLKTYNDDFFYNYKNPNKNESDYKICKSENDSYIEFDFGSKKVDLFSYLIRSNCDNNWYHAKSWSMNGSNDGKQWELLDLRLNVGTLNGPKKEYNFQCQQSKYGNINNRFKYIRFIQKDSWHDNKYNIKMTFFELFGDIYDEN